MSPPSGASPLHGITTRVPRSAARKGRVALGVGVTARLYRRPGGRPGAFSPVRRTPHQCSTRTRDGLPTRLEQRTEGRPVRHGAGPAGRTSQLFRGSPPRSGLGLLRAPVAPLTVL